MTEQQLIPTIVQGGSFGALVYIIWWATAKLIPVLESIQASLLSMQATYFAKIEERDTVYQASLLELHKNCEECRDAWRDLVLSGRKGGTASVSPPADTIKE